MIQTILFDILLFFNTMIGLKNFFTIISGFKMVNIVIDGKTINK